MIIKLRTSLFPPSCQSGVFAILLVLLQATTPAVAASESFQRIESETLAGQPFVFPDDLRAAKLNIVMLAISEEQENGSWQGDALLEWYAALEKAGLLSNDVMAWHLSVLKVPFFVKGLVRGGMAKSYKGKVPLDQAAALFVKDVGKFAESAGIELDGQPTIILVSPAGEMLYRFKGVVSDAQIDGVREAVGALGIQPGESNAAG